MTKKYTKTMDHDSCGIGAVVNIDGRRTHAAVDDALNIVEHLGHRAGKDASGEVGDGVGLLVKRARRMSHKACRGEGNRQPGDGHKGGER